MQTLQKADDELSPAARLSALESWRENVLRGMLTVAAIVSPLIVIVSMVLQSGPESVPRTAAFVGAGLAFPALRFAPGLSVAVRATLAIGLAFATGVVALTTFGFSSGPGIVLAGTSILAVVLLGRVRGFIFIVLSVVAFFVGRDPRRARRACRSAGSSSTRPRCETGSGSASPSRS